MIQTQGLTKRYAQNYALRQLNLTIREGTCLAVFGANGAGKSTLLRLIALLTAPTSGQVLYKEQNISDAPEAFRSQIGVIGHASYLYDDLTAVENLLFYARLYGLDDAEARAKELLLQVGLQKRSHSRVRTFSRGMQQRLSIARAILHDPEILLLDEPFTGLDQQASALLSDWLLELKSRARTVVLVTHNVEQGIALADDAAILQRGRLHTSLTLDAESRAQWPQRYREVLASEVTA